MKKILLVSLFCGLLLPAFAQLSIEKIMADPKISVGALPSGPWWSEDSRILYFNWNPELKKADSLYAVSAADPKPARVDAETRRALPASQGAYNRTLTQKVYARNGDLFLLDCTTMRIRPLTNTVENERDPAFSADGGEVFFTRAGNLFSLSLADGLLTQRTNFQKGNARRDAKGNEQEEWLKQDQMALFEVLQQRADKRKEGERNAKADRPKRPKTIYLGDKEVDDLQISPDGRFVVYTLREEASEKIAQVPSYVTESGFTENLETRAKVGGPQNSHTLWLYDIGRDTVLRVSTDSLAGLADQPDFYRDYPDAPDKPGARELAFRDPVWSDDARFCVVEVSSLDNKDRWIAQLDLANARLITLDRQRDEAWIGGPVYGFGFLADNRTLYYRSEADGYAHLYTLDLETGQKTQLTRGKFEVQTVQLSRNKQHFYLTTNEVHPGEKHCYRMSVTGGERTRLTPESGAYQVFVSPDETRLAYLYSTSTQPWELFIQDNKAGATPVQVTFSQSEQFRSYAWRTPKLVTIRAADGAEVYARLYEAKGRPGRKPAVIFVHGAGYLQNAHRWWSQYFREYMFHNFLADQGYTVLDMDYRGSAGYGRDWRTGIYRHMGGKDLSDHVDGARWLVENQGVDPKRIGIYGGSYGGFITLMGMFTTPDVFAAGAALRPVTDWAAYNHGYTSNILNTPAADSLAYRRSSPIYHAGGLKGHLLICHGMVDVNVHFQDVVRLAQRLIELKKDNWELAAYPVEDHAFAEPSSWRDEYARIFALFERVLKK